MSEGDCFVLSDPGAVADYPWWAYGYSWQHWSFSWWGGSTGNSEAPVESFSYLQGADGSFDCDLEDCNGLSVSSCKVNLK